MIRQTALRHVEMPTDLDDVDALVEALVADPSRAEDVKALLRERLAMPSADRPTSASVIALVRDSAYEDDLWDNVPV